MQRGLNSRLHRMDEVSRNAEILEVYKTEQLNFMPFKLEVELAGGQNSKAAYNFYLFLIRWSQYVAGGLVQLNIFKDRFYKQCSLKLQSKKWTVKWNF